MAITASDGVGLAFFLSFGLWWVCFPASVIRFYTWFHRREMTLPAPGAVRLVGGLWCALVILVFWTSISR